MKQSTKLLTDLNETLAKLRKLNAEAEASQPIRRNWKLSAAENEENFHRANRLDKIIVKIRKANEAAATLRKQYSEAIAAEQLPPPAAPAKSAAEIPRLQKQIAECEKFLADLPDSKRPHILPASRGDRKAIDALDKVASAETKARDTIALSTAALAEIQTQNAETQREFAERDADEKHRAGLAAAEALVAWAEKFDNLLGYVAAHFAKLPELQRALAKSGADVNTDLTNRLYPKASRDRAAKAAGLHHCFSIDATVQPVPLGDAFGSLMKAAVRRPTIERKIA